MTVPSAGITGYVLAGGRSARMGRDKALLDDNGPNLLQRALNVLLDVCAEAYILSGPRNDERDALLSCYAPLVPDAGPDHAGPVAGLLAALRHCPTPYACFVAVDQPGITPKHLETLLAAATEAGASAACFQPTNGTLEPLPLVLSGRLRTLLAEQWSVGERRLLAVLQAAAQPSAASPQQPPGAAGGLLRVPLANSLFPPDASPLINLNSPSDLETWRATRTASNQSLSDASEKRYG